MKFKILFFIMPIIFLISCHHSESVDPNEIQFGPWDYKIIPDMAKGAGVNACVMFQLEFSDVDNVSFENLYVNGGGKWFPITCLLTRNT